MVVILFTVTIFLHILIVSSDKHDILPPVFKMENYTACINRNNAYCKIDVRLMNNGTENNPLWSLIKDTINSRSRYDRSIIHRAICIPKNKTFNLELTKKYSQLPIEEELRGTNLLGSIENVICLDEDNVKISYFDKWLILFCTAYISLIVYATVKDLQRMTRMDKWTENKLIASLSIISNWRKVCKTEGNEDYNKLKSVQGIRFYNMLLIINLHTLFSFTTNYLSNTAEVEEDFKTFFVQAISNTAGFLVHTFFMISSWMVTYQIYNIYRDHGKFTLKHALILIINRFFRIGVCLAVSILLLRSSMCQMVMGPSNFDDTRMVQESCTHNWWQSVFFVNNFLYPGDICNVTSWYLSVDFQLYIMATITIYLILKFKLNEWKVIGFLIILSLIIFSSVLYIKDLGMIMRLDINTARRYVFYRSNLVRMLYISTYSNWTTGLVGTLLGIIYTKNKYRNINSKFVFILWLSLFFGLPTSTIFIASSDISGFPGAIMGSLLRPLFSLGIGVGILGMSHNIGGIIKTICENKYVVMLSNFSFCAYVFQIFVIFTKGIGYSTLIEFNRTKMIKYLLFFDAPVTILLGIICTVIIEQPAVNLQKIFLPQIARGKEKSQKDQ